EPTAVAPCSGGGASASRQRSPNRSGWERADAIGMTESARASPRRVAWPDAVFVALLVAATVGYLAALPLNLGSADEGHLLHVAKRVLQGEVIYRDVFDLSTPGWTFLMAGVVGLFGTTLDTARITVALIHGVTVALTFLACRWLGVGRSLAVAAAFIYLVALQPMFPVASYHWLATCLTVALLVLCLHASPSSAAWALL